MSRLGQLALSFVTSLENTLRLDAPEELDLPTLRGAIDLYGLSIYADGTAVDAEKKLYDYLVTHGPSSWGPVSPAGALVKDSLKMVKSIQHDDARTEAVGRAAAQVTTEMRPRIFEDCIMLILADGAFDPREATLVETLRDVLSIPGAEVGRHIDNAETRYEAFIKQGA